MVRVVLRRRLRTGVCASRYHGPPDAAGLAGGTTINAIDEGGQLDENQNPVPDRRLGALFHGTHRSGDGERRLPRRLLSPGPAGVPEWLPLCHVQLQAGELQLELRLPDLLPVGPEDTPAALVGAARGACPGGGSVVRADLLSLLKRL